VGIGTLAHARRRRASRDALRSNDDWDAALAQYARQHDEYYGALHRIHEWMTQLVWTPGPEADADACASFLGGTPTRPVSPTAWDSGHSVQATSARGGWFLGSTNHWSIPSRQAETDLTRT
jgi:hypothetical protein